MKVKNKKIIFLLIIIVSIIFFCTIELFFGISQLLSGNKVVGSFYNTGPFGGYLSVCVSVLIPFCFYYKKYTSKSVIIRVIHSIASIVSIIALIILPSTLSRSAFLALGCSMFILVKRKNVSGLYTSFRQKPTGILIAICVLVALAYLIKKPSADGRFLMEKISMNIILENKHRGVGNGYFGGVYGEGQANYFKKQIDSKGINDMDWNALNEKERLIADCPKYPFNEYLYIGIQHGTIAMFSVLLITILLLVMTYKRDYIWFFGFNTLAIFSFFSYPFHFIEFHIFLSILIIACVFSMIQAPHDGIEKRKDLTNRITMLLMATVLIFVSTTTILKIFEVNRQKLDENKLNTIKQLYAMEYYDYFVEECEKVLPTFNKNEDFLKIYGLTLSKKGNHEKCDSILKIGTKISSNPIFWNEMGNNYLLMKKYREAEECYKHSFYMIPNRLYPLNLLAKLYYTEGDTARFLDIADRVEKFVPKVESATTAKFREEIRGLKADIILKQEQ